jgi:hypothetical protein
MRTKKGRHDAASDEGQRYFRERKGKTCCARGPLSAWTDPGDSRRALAAMERNSARPLTFLARHQAGEWGDLDSADVAENEYSANRGLRLLSAYTLWDRTRIWIVTEADRSSTMHSPAGGVLKGR